MDNFNTNPLYTDDIQQVRNTLTFAFEEDTALDPLALDIPDTDLEQIVKERVKASEKFFEQKYNLKDRREKNEKYLFGRQLSDKLKRGELKDYETRASDNAIYEIEASLKPLAMSKLPDIIVTPGDDDPAKEQTAKDLSIAIDDMNKKREQREVLGMAFKHLPVYFTAVLKARWDSEAGTAGEYTFDVINPNYIVVDHTATTRNPDDMSYIAQVVPMTVQEALMKFPKKRDELLKALKLTSYEAGEMPTQKELATEFKLWEVWFDWYEKDTTGEVKTKDEMSASIFEPGLKWKRVCGVLWQYDNVILEKMLDPNYDHTGEKKLMAYNEPDNEASRYEVNPEDAVANQILGNPLQIEEAQIYHNYFTRPHKPYYFFGYDQWGKIPYDETSRLEQNIRNQENLDDQNKTILDQLKTRIKHIWSRDGGLDKAAIQRMDMDDPKMDAIVDGNPNLVHKSIEPERPDSPQFKALEDTRQRMYAISGSTAVRGQIQSDTATTNQIAREADFTRTDDLVEDTINAACEWMAGWQMQFIKLRYTEEHMRQILGDKGKMTYVKLRRDMISDGMEVRIKASSTDKLKAQRNAMQMAQLGAPFTNPIDLFKDMDMNDAEGRTERGMMFMQDPAGYMLKYAMGMETAGQMAAGIGQPQPMPGQEQTPPASGGQPAPQQPTPEDTSAIPTSPPPVAPMGSPRAL